jgi:Fe-S cluster biosynthesis and repair protein YggX
MNGMKIGKKIEIETLNLKFITEQLELVEQQNNEGVSDLYFRLSHFRKRVISKDKDRYDEYFFGKGTEHSDDNKEKELPVICKRKSDWIKKIYRKIVLSTHPDKFQNFPVESLKQKYLNIYRKAIDAWSQRKDDIILLLAYEADVEVCNPEALLILQQGNKQKSIRLKEVQNLLTYQWYHIPESEKSKVLEKYLSELGYDFTKEEVEKVVNLPRKRKVGTRPKNYRKLKNVK